MVEHIAFCFKHYVRRIKGLVQRNKIFLSAVIGIYQSTGIFYNGSCSIAKHIMFRVEKRFPFIWGIT